MADGSVLEAIDKAFGAVARPEHFCADQYWEYDEATEHDRLLVSRTRETLSIDDVGNPGWDPLCFSSAQGIAYFMPALARFALAEATACYAPQLLFHVYHGFKDNKLWLFCDRAQKEAIAGLLNHLIMTRAALIEDWGMADEVFRAYELWSEN